jgi:hypothetical protein
MFNATRRQYIAPLLAGTTAAALLVGGAAGAGAQVSAESLPQQQAALPASATMNAPPLPLGRDDVREVQNQLIALGFDPGPADGQIGPATTGAAQQYDQNRGGNGRVAIDSEFLARLKADTGPRLSYDQVAARSQARQAPVQSQAYSAAPSSSSRAAQFGNVVQQIAPLIGAMIANSNANSGYGYGPGYYDPGPRYYGPGPSYYGPGPGYWHGY